MPERKVTYSETEPPNPNVGDGWIHTTTRVEKIWNGASWETVLPASAIVFTKLGALEVGTNATLAILAPNTLDLDHIRCYLKTAPGGADVIVDINKNGITIFTTQGNRPTVPDGQNKGAKSATPDVTSVAEGDVITLDIDQIGSVTPGSDLTVYVRCKQ